MAGGAGRPPVPTAIKEARGTARPDRARDEPKPQVYLPPPPKHLPDAAKREWRRIGRELKEHGLVTRFDLAALEVYVSAYALHAEASEALKNEGRRVKIEGYLVELDPGVEADPENKVRGRAPRTKWIPPHWEDSPWITDQRVAWEAVLKALREFGLSPASRTKVAGGKVEAADPFDALLGGKVTPMRKAE